MTRPGAARGQPGAGESAGGGPSTPRQTPSERARELERADLERTRAQAEAAEGAHQEVKHSIGLLLEAGRTREDLPFDAEDTKVRRLSELTGQSGTMRAVAPSSAATAPSPPPSFGAEGPITKRPTDLDTRPRVERVLVVDDDQDIADAIAEALRDEGYGVRTAEDGIEALRKILKDTPPPDVVILDVGLPYVDGPTVASVVQRSHLADLPIVWMSAAPVPAEHRRDWIFIRKSSALNEHLKAELSRIVAERVAEWRARLR